MNLVADEPAWRRNQLVLGCGGGADLPAIGVELELAAHGIAELDFFGERERALACSTVAALKFRLLAQLGEVDLDRMLTGAEIVEARDRETLGGDRAARGRKYEVIVLLRLLILVERRVRAD